MLEGLTDLVTDSPTTYLTVLALVAGDAIVPLFPGETSVVVAAVLSADGQLVVWLVFAAAAIGAFLGDLTGYLIGHFVGPRVLGRLSKGEKGRARVEKAKTAIHERGTGLIVAAQFLPGGRNVVMVTAGALGFPRRTFLVAEAIGAVLWAAFQTSIGYLGGRAFTGTWTALIVSVGIGIAFGVGIERFQHLRQKRRRRAASRPAVSPAESTGAG